MHSEREPGDISQKHPSSLLAINSLGHFPVSCHALVSHSSPRHPSRGDWLLRARDADRPSACRDLVRTAPREHSHSAGPFPHLHLKGPFVLFLAGFPTPPSSASATVAHAAFTLPLQSLTEMLHKSSAPSISETPPAGHCGGARYCQSLSFTYGPAASLSQNCGQPMAATLCRRSAAATGPESPVSSDCFAPASEQSRRKNPGVSQENRA